MARMREGWTEAAGESFTMIRALDRRIQRAAIETYRKAARIRPTSVEVESPPVEVDGLADEPEELPVLARRHAAVILAGPARPPSR